MCRDIELDGRMDLYVSNMFSSAGSRVAYQRRFQSASDPRTKGLFHRHARGNSLFQSVGDPTEPSFLDVSAEVAVTMGRWAWASLFMDINNDGWEDLLVANGLRTGESADDL